MRIIKLTLFILTALLLSVNSIFAQEVEMQINSPASFEDKEAIFFGYVLVSDESIEVAGNAGVNCPCIKMPLQDFQNLELYANEIFYGKYDGIIVGSEIQSQTCTAFIQISSPIDKKIEKEFKIEITPSFQVNLNYCKDQSCKEKTKVFVLNDDIYLSYASEVNNPEITAKLIYPDKIEKQIILPTSIKAEQVGNYELEITAKKDGYKTVNKKDMFGVIGEQVKIKSTSICNADGICASPENIQNCPQDCIKTKQAIDKTNVIDIKIIIAIIAIVIIIAIMIAAYWFLVRKSSRAKIAEDNKEDNQIDNFK